MAISTTRSSYRPSGPSLRAATSGNPASIAVTVTAAPHRETIDVFQRHRGALLGIAAARFALALVAVPLAPLLYREHAQVLVLLRPSKEVLLFAGYTVAKDDLSPVGAALAALPLLLGGVWVMFALGRGYADSIGDRGRSGIAGRLLPPERIEQLTRAIEEQDVRLVVLGRLAAFPSTLVAAAAGAAGMSARRFFVADTAGALLSLVALVGIGFALEDAYESAGPWITAAGVAVLAAAVVVLGRSLSRAGRAR